MRKELILRGAIEVVSHAISHIGRGQRIDDWDGSYRNKAIEDADKILRKILWELVNEFAKKSGKNE